MPSTPTIPLIEPNMTMDKSQFERHEDDLLKAAAADEHQHLSPGKANIGPPNNTPTSSPGTCPSPSQLPSDATTHTPLLPMHEFAERLHKTLSKEVDSPHQPPFASSYTVEPSRQQDKQPTCSKKSDKEVDDHSPSSSPSEETANSNLELDTPSISRCDPITPGSAVSPLNDVSNGLPNAVAVRDVLRERDQKRSRANSLENDKDDRDGSKEEEANENVEPSSIHPLSTLRMTRRSSHTTSTTDDDDISSTLAERGDDVPDGEQPKSLAALNRAESNPSTVSAASSKDGASG